MRVCWEGPLTLGFISQSLIFLPYVLSKDLLPLIRIRLTRAKERLAFPRGSQDLVHLSEMDEA